MKRLTKAIRAKMIEAAVKEVIEPRNKAIAAKGCELASDIYSAQYKKHYTAMIDLPKGFLIESNTVKIEHTRKHKMSFRTSSVGKDAWFGKDTSLSLKTPERTANKDYYGKFNLTAAHGRRLETLIVEAEKLFEDEGALETTLNEALNAVTTVKQLEVQYPDLVKYLPVEEPAMELPAITNEKVAEVLKCSKKGDC